MVWPTAMRETAYQLRAQGLSTRAIQAALIARFPGQRVADHETVRDWLADPEAYALVRQAEARIRATVTHRTQDVIGGTYTGLEDALETKDFRAVDAYSRAIVNLTRGFVQERLEITPAKSTDAPDELAALLARLGVSLDAKRDDAPAHTPDNG